MSLTPEEWLALLTSLAVAGRALAFALPLAVLAAWLLSRPRLPGRLLLNALAHAPLVLPPVVVGYGLLLLFGVKGPVGAVLFNRQGLVFDARRADLPNAEGAPGGWQLPQGGIDEGIDFLVVHGLQNGGRRAELIGLGRGGRLQRDFAAGDVPRRKTPAAKTAPAEVLARAGHGARELAGAAICQPH